MQHLIELEQHAWRALCTTREEAKQFYGALLTEDAVMLFPGGTRIEGKEEILESIGAQPWSSFQLDAPQVLSLGESSGIVVYKATAQREGSSAYEALISSAYTFDGKAWKMAFHQQTPV